MGQQRLFERASVTSAIAPIATESPHCVSTWRDRRSRLRWRPDKDRAMTTRPSVMMEQQDLVTAHTQIIRHIAELLQYDRVRKLANVRIACTLECDRPALAGSRDIPSARLIAAASL
jgi:hypothetical protein